MSDQFNRNSTGVHFPQSSGRISEPVEPAEPSRIREVGIRQLDNGYIVSVGCKSFVFTSKEDLLSKLNLYLTDPVATEISLMKGELFSINL